MKRLIGKIFDSHPISRIVIKLGYETYYKSKFLVISERQMIRKRYFLHHGEYPDLVNPKKFSEKINWLKLYERNSLQQKCADKLQVRDFVAAILGKGVLVPLLASYDNLDEFDPEKIKYNHTVIVKTTHDSKGGYVIHPDDEINCSELKQSLRRRILKNHFYVSNEWQYRNIKPKIIIEKFLTENDGPVDDFKLYCFNGKVALIQHDASRSVNHSQNFYDTDWQPLAIEFVAPAGQQIKPPTKLKEMITYAETLSSDFKFARIDFYIAYDKIYFGEITFHPESGYRSFNPPEWELKLGNMIILR